jgi:superfamily II DNA/RNA helicase
MGRLRRGGGTFGASVPERCQVSTDTTNQSEQPEQADQTEDAADGAFIDVVPSHPEVAALDHSTTGAELVAELTPEQLAAERAAHAAAAQGPSFADLGVRAETVQALASVGITHAFAIQELTLPIALAGSDLIGQARTGTGKTLGFGIPLIQRIKDVSEGADGAPQALIIVPTRELCVQVTADLKDAGKTRGLRVLSIYGGRAFEPQVEALKQGVDIVVGTPGRLIDLAQQGHLRLGMVQVLVLDEADEMLDLGFLPDVERIVSKVPELRQTMLFSATMPGPIIALARRFMRNPVHMRASSDDNLTVPTTRKVAYRAHAMDKIEVVGRILQARDRGLTMIFCRTKRTAQKVSDELADRGFASAAVHGDLGQGAREQALRAFRAGKVDVLVATDVAARGIDVENVTHVINYQCPDDEKTFVHRIGRTGRAGKDGIAVTFVDWDDLHKWETIDRELKLGMGEPPETYSTSPHLYSDLNIPEGTKGRLPRSARTREGLDAEVLEDLGETGRRNKPAERSGPRSASSGGRSSGAGSGRSSGSGSGRSSGGGSGGSSGGSAPAGTPARAEKPAGAPRQRNRTRGTGPALSAAEAAPAQDGSPDAAGDAPRRRRRGGRGRGAGSASPSATPTD